MHFYSPLHTSFDGIHLRERSCILGSCFPWLNFPIKLQNFHSVKHMWYCANAYYVVWTALIASSRYIPKRDSFNCKIRFRQWKQVFCSVFNTISSSAHLHFNSLFIIIIWTLKIGHAIMSLKKIGKFPWTAERPTTWHLLTTDSAHRIPPSFRWDLSVVLYIIIKYIGKIQSNTPQLMILLRCILILFYQRHVSALVMRHLQVAYSFFEGKIYKFDAQVHPNKFL